MNTLHITAAILGVSIIISFLYGLITRNYSTVDRLWSILPGIYCLVWMTDYYDNVRFIIAACLIIVWGARLTFNFARRGGYAFSWKQGFSGEDYRWAVLRNKIQNRILFEIFNLVFISFFQLALVFWITVPLYYVGQIQKPLNTIDILLFALHAVLLVGETIADNQQCAYHRKKNLPEYAANSRYQLGFNTFGLWRFSRHPNYACEIGQWIIVACYAINASGTLHKSGIGAIVLIVLFVGSTALAESITASKYSRYREWCGFTACWIPLVSLIVNGTKRRAFFDSLKA